MRTTQAWISRGQTALERAEITRRDLRPNDVAIRIDYCGVCHSDLHAICDNDPSSALPLVPGHEFSGTVIEVGTQVKNLSVGDTVAVGNIVDSCMECDMCQAGQENFCRQFPTLTYGGVDRVDGTVTFGAFAREYVVREEFAYRLPEGLDLAAAAPLMCAGVTVWEPLRALGVGPETRVAVVGLGGLGHLAVKLAVALGAETTVISRTSDKAEDAKRLGAQELLLSTDQAAMAASRGQFDVILDTVAVNHDLAPYLSLLALDGELCLLGYLGNIEVAATDLLIGRKKLSSAGSGGRASTAELLRFCAEHDVDADVEVLSSKRVNESLERLEHGDVRYRFVLDLSDLDA